MRNAYLVPLILVGLSGCQTTMLRKGTIDQAQSIDQLYYEQVMENIAMHAEHPATLPYFSYPSGAQNAVQRTVSMNYQLSWDLITSAGALFRRYLFDKQSSQVTGTSQKNEQWNTLPTTDPDKIQLILFAYEKAFGFFDPEHQRLLKKILDKETTAKSAGTYAADEARLAVFGIPVLNDMKYYEKVRTGWFCIGSKHDVPKDACYVAHCGPTYAWVTSERVQDLADFTLAVLDIATYQAPGKQTGAPAFGTAILPPAP